MNIAKLEPTLRMLLTADQEELSAQVALGRIALEIVDGVPRVTVLATHDGLPELAGVEVLSSRGDIATLRLDLETLDELSERPEIVYINAARSGKPVLHRTRAQIGAAIVDGRSIRQPAEPWDGTGTTVGVIDTGFDVRHPAFRQYPGGPTRVHLYWDRSIAAADRRAGDQAGFNGIGVLYDRTRIDAHLLGPAASPPVLHPNSVGVDEHGTHVAGIAAGSAAPYRGVAKGANLILVRTGTGDLSLLADICDWVFQNAIGPCSINVSLGNNNGPHDGTSATERALDDLLRNPGTLTPFEGRLISVAAGNEANKAWHVRARVLGTDGPVTPILWESPFDNTGRDEIVFACSGHDRIRLRLRAPGGVRTNFVTPDPANGNQSIDEAVPGGLAPTAAGAQAEKIFNFADGTSVRIAHVEDQFNGDRQIEVHFRPPPAPPAGQAITDGVWQLEFQGATNTLPGGGILHGFLRDDVPDVTMDSSFLRPAVATRTLRVNPGATLEQDVFVNTSATAEAIVVLDYPGDRELEFQLRPPLHLLAGGANPTQWVRHGDPDPVAVADAALTAPGAVNADHRLPFALGPQQAEIGHGTSGSRRRITLRLPGAGPTAGLYRMRLRALSGDRPIEVEARLQQDASGRFELTVFRDDPNEVVELGVFPAATIESGVRLRANGVPERVSVRVSVADGALVDARVRFAPADGALPVGGHPFTPWVGPGNAETAAPGSIAIAGGAAGPRIYNDGADARVEIAYPAAAAGSAGVIDITFSNPTAPTPTVRGGEWRIELRGRDDRAHRARCELRHVNDGVDDFSLAQLSPVEQDQLEIDLLRTPSGPTAIPFTVDRDIGDEVRLELLYDAANSVRARLLPADPERLRFAVEAGNHVVTDPGAPAPAAGAGGVTATLASGTVVVLDHPAAPVFPGMRRVLITIRSPAGRVAFPQRGVWRLEVEQLTSGASPLATVRLATDGRPATFLTYTPANDDLQQGSLSVPGSAREIMSVANCLPSSSSVTLPAGSTSPGPVRYATRMRIGGASRPWQPYTKPEVSAPGSDIASAHSGFAPLWLNSSSAQEWATITLPDGRSLAMHEGFPMLEGDQPRVVHPVQPAPAAGTLTQTVWEVEFPDFSFSATLRVRYPVGNPFAVRMEQPGAVAGVPAPPAPNRTHAVGPNGAEIVVAGAGVAAGAPAPPHPDGPGRRYTMGDDCRVIIRQNGAGLASVEFTGTIHPGRWRLIVQHDQVLPAAVPVAVEIEPAVDPRGWPKVLGQNPRQDRTINQATAAAPGEVNFRLSVPTGFMPTVTVDLSYPPPPVGAGAYSFELLVVAPAGNTHAIDTNSVQRLIVGGAPTVAPAVPNGARYGIPHGPSGANHVVITHTPGHARVTISRGTSTAFVWADGDWDVRLLNRSQTSPAAPVTITAEVEIGPHDAPFFRVPDGFLPATSTRFGHLVAGAAQEWQFRVPPRRRVPLALTVIYDSRDTLELQVQDPGGARTEAVGLTDAPNAGAPGATLPNTGVGPDGVEFLSAGSFRAVISHRVQPLSSTARNEVKVTLHPVADAPLPHGDWILHLRPSAVNAASNGVVEAWIEELLFRTLTGTSMASPHVAGLAALLFQQDHTRTHADIKRLLISTARPLVITRGGSLQLPNQWDPTAGWGLVDGAAALLGHTGGPLHNRGGSPAAIGKTTGCPVACDDNCLLEGVRTNGSVLALRPTRDAPYNRAPLTPVAVNLATCRRQEAYMAERTGTAFTGGGSFVSIASRRVDRPLRRDREQRGTLDGFEVVSWEDAYESLVDRWVDQWIDNGGVLLIEPRPRLGLVRELIFNLFSHQLHRLLSASTTVTKCSFTIKKTVSVSTSRVPFGAVAGGAADRGLREIWNGNAPRLAGRGEISLARSVVLWGANLPGTSAELWATLQAMHSAQGDSEAIFAVDPGLQALPSYVRRVAILPGSDRDLALALMLRIVGNPGHADAARQIPEDPRFADAGRGLRPMLDVSAPTLGDFITHIRDVAAPLLRIDGGRVVPDAALLERCLGAAAPAAAETRFRQDFDALFETYLGGPVVTVLGDGPGRFVEGEENIQYIAALSFVSGNMGRAGGGIAYAEDREASFNPPSFSGRHNTRRPEGDVELGSEQERETINLASMAADAPENSKIALWFDLDPMTALPDAGGVEALLRRTQFNVQVTGRLDDSSRFADIILPLGDSLISYDLQLGARSPWINLTQPIEAPAAEGPRPFARIAHELFAALWERLHDRFEDDLKPVINQDIMKRGPLLVSPTRRRELADFFNDANRIPNLLRDRLPADEVANIHTQLKNWYAGVHGGEPTTDTDDAVRFGDPVKFFNRMQVDWILEVLLDRYSEREAVMVLYNLLQRGTVLDPARFEGDGFAVHADGDTAFAEALARGNTFANLKGAAGFAPERPAYRDAVRAVDTSATGRAAYPMHLVIAEAPEYGSGSIPLSAQVEGGRIKLPIVVVNPESGSLAGRFGGPLADGAEVAIVGNVSYAAGQRFETVIARAQVRVDATMARETLWMNPGWHGLDRGGQRVARGIHTEEGESPAIFDNLVRLEPANYSPTGNAADRGTPPPKR